MKNIEFHTTPDGEVLISNGETFSLLKPGNRDFMHWWMDVIAKRWPEALLALEKKFNHLRGNIYFFEFKIVRMFLKCNFGNYDGSLDVDELGNFNFEEVHCTLRGGDCDFENIVCKPKFNHGLSDRELEVMKLYYKGFMPAMISEKLFISEDTVVTHKKNVFKRLNIHSLAELITYSKNNNLFNC